MLMTLGKWLERRNELKLPMHGHIGTCVNEATRAIGAVCLKDNQWPGSSFSLASHLHPAAQNPAGAGLWHAHRVLLEVRPHGN